MISLGLDWQGEVTITQITSDGWWVIQWNSWPSYEERRANGDCDD